MSPTLIESELFGHKRGAFTGALGDRTGWFETCPATGTVFLDEIGDLDAAVQVKLLRVLQSRRFERVGDTRSHTFKGKIIAATNRDLAQRMADGACREDFYYRLCSDIITTPSLSKQLMQRPAELHDLVLHIAHQLVGDEAQKLADEVVQWIDAHLGVDYPWPGNVRELEQCVRNVLIRHEYHPPTVSAPPDDVTQAVLREVAVGGLTADD